MNSTKDHKLEVDTGYGKLLIPLKDGCDATQSVISSGAGT